MMDIAAQNTATMLLGTSQGNGTEVAKKLKEARELEKIASASEEFEAVFISEMMKPMFSGISSDGMFGGGKGEEIFRGMLLQEYGKVMAQTRSIGLSDTIKAEMIRMQENKQ